jgi:hypothetical protein
VRDSMNDESVSSPFSTFSTFSAFCLLSKEHEGAFKESQRCL